MKSLKYVAVIGVLLINLTACQTNNKIQSNPDSHKQITDELSHLVQLMTGEFNSLNQSISDKEYFYISLKMKPIWSNRTDGYWLYVEQAVGDQPDQPYRQRIYHVTAVDDNLFSSAVFELPDAQSVIGAYENPALLSALSPDDLTVREGCAVVLNKMAANHYSGSTAAKTCLSELRGATYATSTVEITATSISSWDQGFDHNDQQVWGATAGPYVFDRQ